MKELFVVIYSMKNCPHCTTFKDLLVKENITFFDRDIDVHEEEYDMFIKAADGNDFVPAFMIIETDGENHKTEIFVPGRDFNELSEGVEIIKENHEKFNL